MWECGRFHSALHFGHCLLQAAWFCIHLQAELAAEAQAGSLQQQHVLDCRGPALLPGGMEPSTGGAAWGSWQTNEQCSSVGPGRGCSGREDGDRAGSPVTTTAGSLHCVLLTIQTCRTAVRFPSPRGVTVSRTALH